MVSIDIYAAVRDAVREIEASGADEFTPQDVADRIEGEISLGEIRRTLVQIWQQEGGIYDIALGGLWAFGYKPAPNLQRNPIGRRR